jgi:hypothetical protein
MQILIHFLELPTKVRFLEPEHLAKAEVLALLDQV